MSLHPPKLIHCTLVSANALDLWAGLPGDPWIGQPWSWTCQLAITAQLHSDSTTPHPFQYGGADIAAGDWIFTTGGGRVLRVRSVTSWTDPVITLVLEDVDRINQLSDDQQSGSAGIALGAGLIFTANAGVPALYPMPDSLVGLIPASSASQILSRFLSLRRGERVEVVQVAHGFAVGTTVAISGSAYVAVPTIAGALTPIGLVVETDDLSSGPDKFYYRPFGTLAVIAVPGGSLGSPLYRSATGQLTLTQPSGSPAAVAVWIDSQRVIMLSSAGTSSTPLSNQAVASEDLAAGDLVNLWNQSGALKARKAIATAMDHRADGFVEQSVQSGAIATVQNFGTDGLLSGLTVAAPQFLSQTVAGRTTESPSTATAGLVIQPVGIALSSSSLRFFSGTPELLT